MGRATFVVELNQAKSLLGNAEAKSFSMLNFGYLIYEKFKDKKSRALTERILLRLSLKWIRSITNLPRSGLTLPLLVYIYVVINEREFYQFLYPIFVLLC
jgi:hypothetical protein